MLHYMLINVTLNQWWEDLSSAHQVFWFIAIVFSVLFFIQFVLLLMGLDGDSADSMDMEDHGLETDFSALSLRSIIAFFTFFGWTGVLILGNGRSVWMAVTLATVAGLAAMFIVAYLMFKFAQLEQSGTLNLYNALDQPGEVYLSIPENKTGQGKVHVIIDGVMREMDAVTEGQMLKTGEAIKVVEILDNNTLKVEVLSKLSGTTDSAVR